MTATIASSLAEPPDLAVPIRAGARLRIQHVDGPEILASRGLDVLRSRDGGHSFAPLARVDVSPIHRTIARTPIAARIARAAVHGLVPIPTGGLVATVRGAIVHRAAGAEQFTLARRVDRGRRPLGLGVCPRSESVFFGEYFRNLERDQVHVYGSADGASWERAWTFPAGEVRHVHAVVPDPYRRGLWVLTGDTDQESAIWWTDDGFRTLEPVVRGTQRARAVTVLPTEDAVIVPMDSPITRNLVQRLDPGSGRLEGVCEAPGSVFTGGRAGDLLVLSTALEPSEINTDPRVAVLCSQDGERWGTLAREARDYAFLDDRIGVLQYPMAHFPGGPGASDRVHATSQSLAVGHGRWLTWDADEARAGLRSLG